MTRAESARAWRPSRKGRAVLAAAAVAAIAVALAAVLLNRGNEPFGDGPSERAPARADAVPYDGRSPRQPAGVSQRVLLELQRPALGRREDVDDLDAAAQRAYVVSLRKEAGALRGALRARGVRLTDVIGFERVWNGFAATVRTRDLAAIGSLGVRAQPVRRFYPALSEPATTGGPTATSALPPPPEQEPIALLASGAVSRGVSVEKGYDVVDGDEDATAGTDPRDARRREAGGTALAEMLVRAGERVRPIRVAALQAAPGTAAAAVEEYGTSDQLLAGLERAVDPDGDGDATDRVAVALVAVSAPYAGFEQAPEAEGVTAASRLGTLVVAPAGNEGPARPPSGTIGSPGAAVAALTVGALHGAPSLPRLELGLGDDDDRVDAAILAGAPPAGALERSRTLAAKNTGALLKTGAARLQNTLAVVRAGEAPGSQAAAAATAGARVVLIAEPRAGRVLPAVPAGASSSPVLGVTGAAARAVLELEAGTRITLGRPRAAARSARAARALSPFSSRGPSLDGRPKPDLAAGGSAGAANPSGDPVVVGGTAVAAARAAVAAARLTRERPELTPAQLKRTLMTPGSQEETGLAPAGSPAFELERRATPPVDVGEPTLIRRGGRISGVRFALGAFDRGDPLGAGTAYQPVDRLELEIVRSSGAVARRLTPVGGARHLLPADYEYTLPRRTLADLPQKERLRFRVRARAPLQKRRTERLSASFRAG